MERMIPRFTWGEIAPRERDVSRGAGYQFYRIAPTDVMLVSTPLGIEDYTQDAVEEAIARFWHCVELLAAEHVDRIVLGGAPVSAQLGRERVRALLKEMEEKTGIPGDAPLEAIIAAMARLGIHKIAIGSRWATPLNERIAQYLEEASLEVVGITERGQWAAQAFAMPFEEGLRVAVDVGREAARLDADVQAVWVAGGAAMALHAIPVIEEEFGVPTFTNLSAEVWNGLVRPGVIDPVQGWGRLLATK
ncbi:MAG: maleate isomerase [Chloroflexota bacterium]|jgi:maleate cis-trans isomerase|nr:maleate isomerase [Chloroflexota bacterium]